MNAQLIGKVIDGRYEILECIGEGGMGVVYRARQKSIDRMVAIKMLSANLARDQNWVQRFYNEAKACSRLHHPNTIRMFDFGQAPDGQLFMAMEYLDGHSLRQVITEQAPLQPARVIKILVQCCASLSEAHNLGIIHRDIKADNVFLLDLPGSRDHVKLLDFGVAKLMMSEDFATQVGVVFGTPQYMSPEQGRGEPLTPRSDLYGLGILGYEMLTGQVPFNDVNSMTVIQMHLQQQVPPLPATVPLPVREVIMRALEKDQRRRSESAASMMEECQQVLTALSTGPIQTGYSATPEPFRAPESRPQPAHAAKTMMADQVSLGAGDYGRAGRPPSAVGGSAAADQKTVMFDAQSSEPGLPGGAPGYGAASYGAGGRQPADGYGYGGGHSMPGGASDNRTMLLQDSEGVVSVEAAQRGLPAPSGPAAYSGGASALFWIVCLLTGLAVGVGAYWLVLELGK